LIMLVLLYGTVELAGRRLGYIIMLLGGIAAAYMPFLHGLGPRATRWGFFFVWTLLALGVIGSFAAILSMRALWRSIRARESVPSSRG
jgi:predicted membrane channel-forming protein YqfA (hemolysin III family)